MRGARIWAVGLLAGFISGGGSGVVGGVTASVLDPEHFNFTKHLTNTLALAVLVFLVSGMTGACAYLSKSPLPRDVWTPEERARRLGKPQLTLTPKLGEEAIRSLELVKPVGTVREEPESPLSQQTSA